VAHKQSVCEIRHDRVIDLTIEQVDRYVRAVPEQGARAEYKAELTASFVFSIHTTLEGPARLRRVEIDEMIEADWMWISLDTDVLLESHWEIESIEEHRLPGQPG
jgi:hypothetical protein